MKAQQGSHVDQKPNAWVINPKDRGRKAIKKDNKVYLQDGQEFQIELFNPLKESVLSEIKVNGKSVSSTGLVLRPGERFYLDCFIDDKKKFVFNTYMVENTDKSKEAISVNGLVEVFFYKEETLSLNNWKEKLTPVIEKHYHHHYPWYQPYWYGYPFFTTSGTVTIGGTNVCRTTTNLTNYSFNNVSSSTVDLSKFGNNMITNCSYTSTNSGITSNAQLGNVTNTGSILQKSYSSEGFYKPNLDNRYSQQISSNIETGRIEKGADSSQKFEEINMQFEKLHLSSVVYQLMPESQKPVETKEIKSEVLNFCTQCGRKLGGNENFCPQCGSKLKAVDVVLV
jgi:hypothetical protein